MYLHLHTNGISQFSPCPLLIIQASEASSFSQDSSESSGEAVSPIKSNVPARNSSAAILPRESVCTRGSVNPTDGLTEHRPTSMVAPHPRLTERSIPSPEADCNFELISDQIYQHPRLLLDANQPITPTDGTSESTDVNASLRHRLKGARIDLSVRGSGIENVSKEVSLSFGNEELNDGYSRKNEVIPPVDSQLSGSDSDDSSNGDDGSDYSVSEFVQNSAKHNARASRPITRSSARPATDSDSAAISPKKSASSSSASSKKCIPKATVSLPHTNCSFSSTFDRSKLSPFNDILYAAYRYECTSISKRNVECYSSALLQTLDWSGVYAEVACSMRPSDFSREFHL